MKAMYRIAMRLIVLILEFVMLTALLISGCVCWTVIQGSASLWLIVMFGGLGIFLGSLFIRLAAFVHEDVDYIIDEIVEAWRALA